MGVQQFGTPDSSSQIRVFMGPWDLILGSTRRCAWDRRTGQPWPRDAASATGFRLPGACGNPGAWHLSWQPWDRNWAQIGTCLISARDESILCEFLLREVGFVFIFCFPQLLSNARVTYFLVSDSLKINLLKSQEAIEATTGMLQDS